MKRRNFVKTTLAAIVSALVGATSIVAAKKEKKQPKIISCDDPESWDLEVYHAETGEVQRLVVSVCVEEGWLARYKTEPVRRSGSRQRTVEVGVLYDDQQENVYINGHLVRRRANGKSIDARLAHAKREREGGVIIPEDRKLVTTAGGVLVYERVEGPWRVRKRPQTREIYAST